MKKRKTPVGLVLGLVVVATVVLYVNVRSHQDPNAPAPSPDNAQSQPQTPPQATGDFLASKAKAGDSANEPKTNVPAPAAPNKPGTSMLTKKLGAINPALVKPKPKKDFSEAPDGGWYQSQSGVR